MRTGSSSNAKIRDEQLSLLYGNIGVSSVGTVVVATSTAYVLRGAVKPAAIWAWLALMAAVLVIRLITALAFTSRTAGETRGSHWHFAYWIGAALGGFSWGLGTLLLFPDDLAGQVFLGFIVAGITSGAISSMGASWRSLATFLPFAVAPLSAALLMQDDSTARAMGFLSLFYLGIQLSAGRKAHADIVAAIRTRLIQDETERELQRVARTAIDGFWTWPDIDEGEQWWSARLFEILGFSPGDVEPSLDVWRQIVHRDDSRRVLDELEAGKTLDRPFDIEFRVEHASGKHIWIRNRIASERNADGKVSLSGTVTDITQLVNEREARSATLRELESYKTALDEHAIVAVTDRAGRIEYVNDRFVQISKYGRAELIGKTHQVVNGGYHPRQFWKKVWERISSGRSWTGDVCNRAKDGTEYWLASTIVPLFDETGEITNFIAVRTDITGRKEQERALTELMVEAEAGRTAQANFLSTMSHEIRTPLNGILGMASLLSDTDLDEEQQDFADTIVRSGENLLGIINEILDFSKIEAGKLELDPIPFDLEETVSDVIDLMHIQAREKRLRFRVRYGSAMSDVVGDPQRYRQVLLNLVGNALKFTSAGGITIELEEVEQRDGTVLVRTSVTDTGIGISDEQLAHLFQPFRQADQSTSRKYGGTGLGLAVCKQLAELMGGEVGVTSREGEGSTFWFTARFEANIEPATPGGTHGIRVIVCEPDPYDRESILQALGARGVNTVAAGPDELETALRGIDAPVAVVLIGDSGAGADLDRLVEVSRTANPALSLKFVLISEPGVGIHDRETLEHAGFNAYLSAPFMPSVLMRTITALTTHPARSDRFITRHSVARNSATADDTSNPVTTGDMRILLVEDNVVNQKVALRMFAVLGCPVDVANNGQEALDAIAKTEYDQIYMDCQMPVMDGFEATRRIRLLEQATGTHTRIIAMTANAMEGDRERCLEAGMDDFVTKPVRKEVLREMLQDCRVQSSE